MGGALSAQEPRLTWAAPRCPQPHLPLVEASLQRGYVVHSLGEKEDDKHFPTCNAEKHAKILYDHTMTRADVAELEKRC